MKKCGNEKVQRQKQKTKQNKTNDKYEKCTTKV